eukprot:scaffold22599_cov139-Cylindrotheca_fusiformis.AAC.8
MRGQSKPDPRAHNPSELTRTSPKNDAHNANHLIIHKPRPDNRQNCIRFLYPACLNCHVL